MLRFKAFIAEESSFDILKTGGDSIGLHNPMTRRKINDALQRATAGRFITPYMGYGAATKILAYSGIILPQHVFMDDDGGELVFDATPKIKSEVPDSRDDNKFYVFFQYEPDGEGHYVIFISVVTESELDELLDDDQDVEEDEMKDYEVS